MTSYIGKELPHSAVNGIFGKNEETTILSYVEGATRNGDKRQDLAQIALSDPALEHNLASLRKGQLWLVVTWAEIRDRAEWGDDREAFAIAYDRWDLLEAETRSRWPIVGCVIGPEGCDSEAPLICDFCAGRPTRQAEVVICDRSKPTAAAPVASLFGGEHQAALFSSTRAYD